MINEKNLMSRDIELSCDKTYSKYYKYTGIHSDRFPRLNEMRHCSDYRERDIFKYLLK